MTTALSSVDTAGILKTIYLTSAVAILALNRIDGVRNVLVVYGARHAQGSAVSHGQPKGPDPGLFSLSRALSLLAAIKVPHGWFLHFYVLSVAASLIWAYQLVSQGRLLAMLISHATISEDSAMSSNQVVLIWSMMLIQGSRRLYESIAFRKASSSQMWVGHWALGLLFYALTSVAVWVEGAAVLSPPDRFFQDLRLGNPSLKTCFALPVFLSASALQHDCHRYLSTLKDYIVPQHPPFQRVLAPHYFAECVIYLSLCICAAPRGMFFNRTLMTALVFVVSNLGVTAGTSRDWYRRRFGPESVRDRWNMIPGVY